MFPFIVSIFMLCVNNSFGYRDNIHNIATYSSLDSDNIDTTKALLDAWSSACQSNTGGTVNVPQGTFLLNTIMFKGPCNGPITFNVDGTLMAPSDPSLGEEYWIFFTNIDDLTISGKGTFDGQGSNTWKYCQDNSCHTRPASLKFNEVKNAKIQGIRSMNSKFFHFHIDKCENFYINNEVTIIAPGDSPNTDGMHIANSNNVQVHNVHIATGDDCISLGPGATNINISHVKCGPGHGFSIGSLGKSPYESPVKGVTISESTLTGTTNGVRIKTFGSSAPGRVSEVTFQNIMVKDVENPIIIDQKYCPHGSCKEKGESQVEISNVKFINIRGISSSEVSVNLDCSSNKPCHGMVLQDINLTYKDPHVSSKVSCLNVNGKSDGNHVPPICMNIGSNKGNQVPPSPGYTNNDSNQRNEVPPSYMNISSNQGNGRSHFFRISFISLLILLGSSNFF